MSDQPKKFFTQEREEIKTDLALPSAHDVAALNERKVVALESIAQSLRVLARENLIVGGE